MQKPFIARSGAHPATDWSRRLTKSPVRDVQDRTRSSVARPWIGQSTCPLGAITRCLLGAGMSISLALYFVGPPNATFVLASLGFMLATRTVHAPAGANPVIMVYAHAPWWALLNPVLLGGGLSGRGGSRMKPHLSWPRARPGFTDGACAPIAEAGQMATTRDAHLQCGAC